jgi:tRNA1Val (adenine37-N6)-methyltransferase
MDVATEIRTTLDAMFHGRLALEQSRDGYRFSVDAVLLAHRVAARAPRRALEIGTGCGVVALCAAALAPGLDRCVALEVQTGLAALARQNVDRNGFAARVEIVEADARTWPGDAGGAFDVVFVNPPYFRPGEGHVNPNAERAAARHQVHGSLEDLLKVARRHLARRGWIELVMPALDLGDTLAILTRLGLRRQEIQLMHPRAESSAELALIGAAEGRAWRTTFAPALVMYQGDGSYTAPMQAALAGLPGALAP